MADNDTALISEKERYKAEVDEINTQRKNRSSDVSDNAMTGLAISGGGIRSGTFALGVLQTLRELGLLRRMDYLSTVSGGGYIGSWLVANRYHAVKNETAIKKNLACRYQIEQKLAKYLPVLTASDEDLRQTLTELQKSNQELTEALADLDTFDTGFKNSLTSVKTSNQKLNEFLDMLRSSHAELTQPLAKLKEAYEELSKAVRDLGTEGQEPKACTPPLKKSDENFSALLDTLKASNVLLSEALSNVPTADTDAFLTDDSEHLRHLRRFTCYLTPRTSLVSADTWTAAAIWLRNTISMQVLLGLFLMLLLLLPRLWRPLFETMSEKASDGYWPVVFIGTQVVGLILVGFLSLSRISLLFKNETIKTQWRDRLVIGISVFGALVIAPALWTLATLPKFAEKSAWLHALWVGCTVAVVLVLQYLLCVLKADNTKPWRKRLSERKKDLFIKLKSTPLIFRLLGLATLSVCATCLLCKLVLSTLQHLHQHSSQLITMLSTPFVHVNLYEQPHGALTTSAVGVPLALIDIHKSSGESYEIASAVGMPLALLAYGVLIGFGTSISGANVPSRVREWWSRIAAWLLIIAASWCVLGLFCFEGPCLIKRLADPKDDWLNWKSITAALGWLTTTGAGLLAGKSEKTNGASQTNWIKEVVAVVAPYVFAIGLLLLLSFASEEMLKQAREVNFLNGCSPAAITWIAFILFSALFAALALMLDINELSLNQFYRNRLMRCYLGGARNEETRNPDPFTGMDFNDDVSMKVLKHTDACHFPGPLWIVNTAMNTTNKPDMDVAERQAESFVFTPLHCGFYRKGFGGKSADNDNKLQGYRELEHFGFKAGSSRLNKDEGVTAAFAISASGAAASPNWGYHTSPVTAFLMTIFNVRLGWWLPNPVKDGWKKGQPWAMSRYALKELFGSTSANDNCIYLSDGGHFENLGLYELIRRKCGLIILSDGEQDEGYKFEGLGMAIRRCWVDFGARIEIDVSNIKPKTEGGACGGHCAIGKIYYNDFDGIKQAQNEKPDAWLVYLKLSWTGDEDTDLQEYKAYNPAFPHDNTANQWFSESQFESYRKLGQHVARTALEQTVGYLINREPMIDGKIKALEKRKLELEQQHASDTEIKKLEGKLQELQKKRNLIYSLGEELHTYWTPSSAGGAGAFITNTETLMGIWNDVATTPELRFLDPLVLQWPKQPLPPKGEKIEVVQDIPIPEVGSPEERAGRYLCQRLFQLMENVYLDLDLAQQHAHPDQSGWMTLFRHWVRFEYFRGEWRFCRKTYGQRFRAFWEQALDRNRE